MQKTLVRKRQNQIIALTEEISLLRSAVISLIGQDPEGNYHPEFVKRVFKAAGKKSKYTFRDPESFLAHIRRI